jgi:hypothetical protein
MQIIDEGLNRRAFLKLGAAGMAAAGTNSLLPGAVAEEQGRRSAPQRPLTLRSSALEVLLDSADGVVFEYRLRKSGIRFAGEGFGQALEATLHSKSPYGFATVAVRPNSNKISDSTANFHFTAMCAANTPAVDFTLRYALVDSTVWITMEDVTERTGFELISLSMPSLVTIAEKQDVAWLAISFRSPRRRQTNYDPTPFGEISTAFFRLSWWVIRAPSASKRLRRIWTARCFR